MRKLLAILILLLAPGASAFALPEVTPGARLSLGLTAYRAADYRSAVTDLEAAADGLQQSPGQMQAYETALVYLTLSQMRLGREDDARVTLRRLHAAERLAPTYATLSLGADGAELERFAAALTPDQPLRGRAAVPPSPPKRADLLALREAETALSAARLDDAVRIYSALAASPDVSREVLAEAAAGLYRAGAFEQAVPAFRRFGTFAKGEEDLRYYYAVALFETGSYADAQKELACALPFIVVTDEVTRYRAKIENMFVLTASR